MGLIIKPPSWGYCSTNYASTPSGALSGVNVTAGANNAEGTAVSQIAALTHDVEYLVVGLNSWSATGGNGSVLVDILVDPAGGSSWSELISDLLGGQALSAGASLPYPYWYHFPIWIPAGTSIGVQARTAHTSGVNGRPAIIAYGGNANPSSWWCGQRVEAIGVSPSTSQGTNHTPGASSAYSSWTDFGGPLSAKCGALQFGVQGTNADVTQATGSYWFELVSLRSASARRFSEARRPVRTGGRRRPV
jgi:hypothetical protein